MKKYQIIWYDLNGENGRDEICIEDNETEEDVVKKGYLLYNGNPPGKMHTIILK